ncbi:2-keto-4-pentenoate hydratase [Planococcus sp. 1R117A]|uniref:2-keto-4-pentenoate hydratase n=1 Tax=Planococcus sp. 1R117A TaxID=3447020 RepID=UPI003EDC2DFF
MESIEFSSQKMADILYDAYIHKKQITKELIPPFLKKDEAYELQHIVTSKKATEAAERLAGYKISLTSPETQKLFRSDTPLYGALTTSALSNGTVSLEMMSSPLIEIELIFILKEDLSVEDDVQAILEKTLIAPGIEVPDSRFEDWFPKITLGQVIADSAVAGKIIAGKPVEGLTYEQLADMKGTLHFNGKELASDTSSTVLDHPVHAVKWLVTELAGHGLKLEKGMSVSSGTFILPHKLEKGIYTASYEGIGEVTLNVI